MRFIGGKNLMLDKIMPVIRENTTHTNNVADIFSGSGVVASCFKSAGFRVVTNDMMYFSYVINRGSICLNKNSRHLKILK